jgi:hypothetical protein
LKKIKLINDKKRHHYLTASSTLKFFADEDKFIIETRKKYKVSKKCRISETGFEDGLYTIGNEESTGHNFNLEDILKIWEDDWLGVYKNIKSQILFRIAPINYELKISLIAWVILSQLRTPSAPIYMKNLFHSCSNIGGEDQEIADFIKSFPSRFSHPLHERKLNDNEIMAWLKTLKRLLSDTSSKSENLLKIIVRDSFASTYRLSFYTYTLPNVILSDKFSFHSGEYIIGPLDAHTIFELRKVTYKLNSNINIVDYDHDSFDILKIYNSLVEEISDQYHYTHPMNDYMSEKKNIQ